VLRLYDAVFRESLSATLNIDLDDIRWSQASLPMRWCGLGVRGVVLLASSAYLASAASTTELTSILLPARLRAIKDSEIDAALAAWTTLSSDSLEVSTASTSPSPPVTMAQRVWDDQCCKTQFGKLVRATSDLVDQARLLHSIVFSRVWRLVARTSHFICWS